MGTNLLVADTDGDGILDGAEVDQGTDPLDGAAARIGIIASADTPGMAVDICAFNDIVGGSGGGGWAIAEGTAGPVQVILPFGSSPSRQVKVQGRNFTGTVQIQVVLTPESGASIVYPAQINMTTGNPASVTVNVEFPINTVTRVYAWTSS